MPVPSIPQELQSFISDLNQWTGDVKEKDKALREGRVQTSGSQQQQQPPTVPPVRGRAPPPPDNAPVASTLRAREGGAKPTDPTGSAAGHTYDRSKEKWYVCECSALQLSASRNVKERGLILQFCREKFDVDAALKEVDSDTTGAYILRSAHRGYGHCADSMMVDLGQTTTCREPTSPKSTR